MALTQLMNANISNQFTHFTVFTAATYISTLTTDDFYKS